MLALGLTSLNLNLLSGLILFSNYVIQKFLVNII